MLAFFRLNKLKSQICKQAESLKSRILKPALLLCPSVSLKFISSAFEIWSMFLTCLPYSATLHCGPWWNLGRSQKTLWPRHMWLPWKSQHCVLWNGCKEWQNARGCGARRMFNQILIYSQSLLLRGFLKWRQIAQNTVVVYAFVEPVLFTDTAGAFITSESCYIR